MLQHNTIQYNTSLYHVIHLCEYDYVLRRLPRRAEVIADRAVHQAQHPHHEYH